MLKTHNEANIQVWLKQRLSELVPRTRILDAGAGELRNKIHCEHLDYVSQDFSDYTGIEQRFTGKGLQSDWDASGVDIVSDILDIPEDDASFDAILCSEVLEHIPEPSKALTEFSRLLKPGGKLILTAPFCSLVHMAPYHFSSGFSRYWYEYHLPANDFVINELKPNGDWFEYLKQELSRLGYMERRNGSWSWPFAYALGIMASIYFLFRKKVVDQNVACFGWFCVAIKKGDTDS